MSDMQHLFKRDKSSLENERVTDNTLHRFESSLRPYSRSNHKRWNSLILRKTVAPLKQYKNKPYIDL